MQIGDLDALGLVTRRQPRFYSWDAGRWRCRAKAAAVIAASAGLVLGSAKILPAFGQAYVPGVYESGQDNNLSPDISLDTRFARRQLPVGAQIGALVIAPSLQIDESFNDNIFATQSATHADAITTLTGRTSIDYAHGPNTLDVQGWFAQHLYAVHSTENAWEGSIQANFASAVHDDLQLVANGDVKRLVDPRTDPSGLQGLTPTTYEVYDGTVGTLYGHYESGLLDLRIGADRTTYDPLQGSQGPIITSDRDNIELFGDGTFRYQFAPRRDVYFKIREIARLRPEVRPERISARQQWRAR